MPTSRKIFKQEIKQYLLNQFKKNPDWKIADVGPGDGTYARLIPEVKMDAIEVFERYVTDYNLNEIYGKVHICNIVDFNLNYYDFYILGDILEHLTIEQGTNLMDTLNKLGKKCLVAVPFLAHQGEWGGNIYETHHQPDLTLSVMSQRYPSLNLLYTDSRGPNSQGYAYYSNI
jgi:hypothetical protein